MASERARRRKNGGRARSPQPPGAHTVSGHVRQADGTPVTGLIVRAFDQDLPSLKRDELLGERRTDRHGHYTITYTAEQFRRTEKGRADVVVRVFADNGEPLAASKTIFNARSSETVDLVVRDGPSEYERLMRDVVPLLGSVPLSDLTEDDDTFLAGELAVDRQHIRFLAEAHGASRVIKDGDEQTELQPEVFYGLFRQDLPTDLEALFSQHPGALRHALEIATRRNVVVVREPLGLVGDRLARLAGQQALRGPLNAWLHTALPDEAKQRTFASLYVGRTGRMELFWEQLRAHPDFKDGDTVPDLELAFQLSALTRNHRELIERLQMLRKRGDWTSIRDLAKYDQKDWERIIRDHGGSTPPDVPRGDDATITNYARVMTRTIEQAFPTAAISSRVAKANRGRERDLIRFFKNNNPHFEFERTHVDSFLDGPDGPAALAGVTDPRGLRRDLKRWQRVFNMTPHYEEMRVLLDGNIDSASQVAGRGHANFQREFGSALGDRTEEILAIATRKSALAEAMYARHAPWAHVPVRVIPRSPQIVDSFPDWATLFGSVSFCECRQCRSVLSPAAYLTDMLQFVHRRGLRLSKAGQDTLAIDVLLGRLPDIIGRRPDLADIELSCENTNTLVPYVDLVNEVLEAAIAPLPAFAPFRLSAEREADLRQQNPPRALRDAFQPHLAETAQIVARGVGAWRIFDSACCYAIAKDDAGDLWVTGRSRQTRGTPEELAASPQYLNAGAYDVLRSSDAVFPWSLPFDLWLEESRILLNHLGVPRATLMETFLKTPEQFDPGDPAILAVASEQLGLATVERHIITNEPPLDPWDCWGLRAQNNEVPDPQDPDGVVHVPWLEMLRRLPEFLTRSRLTFAQAMDLLKTRFVNPDGSLAIIPTDPARPCALESMAIDGLDAAAASRVHRFTRLWRKLGWRIDEVDLAIRTLGNPGLDLNNRLNDAFVVRLSHVARLRADLNLHVEQVLALWTNIDTDGENSLYQRLFQNPAVLRPVDSDLRLTGNDLAAAGGSLSAHADAIQAALGITAQDLTGLTASIPATFKNGLDAEDQAALSAIETSNDILNLANLSKLYRIALLSKALRMPVGDLLLLVSVTLLHPFDSARTEETLKLVETARVLRSTRVGLDDLDYLLRHSARSRADADARDENTIKLLKDVRAGLQQIAAEHAFSTDPSSPGGVTRDPTGDLTRRELALLGWDAALIERVVATLADTATNEVPLRALPAGLTPPNAAGTYAVRLASLPQGFAFPADLQGIVTYDATDQALRAARLLAEAERALLREIGGAANDADLVAGVDALLQLQDELRGQISYAEVTVNDRREGRLRFVGSMTDVRKSRLDRATEDPDWRAAVQALYDAPRTFVARHLRVFSIPRFSTPLAQLPANVEFPAVFGGRVYLDSAAEPHQLHFVGVMTAQERDVLLQLSADPAAAHHGAYVAAVTALFSQADALVPQPGDRFLTASGPGTDAAAMFDAPTSPEARFLRVLKKLVSHLRQTLSASSVERTLAAALKLELRTAHTLLNQWVASPVDPEPIPRLKRRAIAEFLDAGFVSSAPNLETSEDAFPAQFRTLTLLHKVALLILKFGITTEQLSWVYQYRDGNDPADEWLDVNALPLTECGSRAVRWKAWTRFADLFQLRDALPSGERVLTSLFSLARLAGTTEPDLMAALSREAGWKLEDLEFLASNAGLQLSFPDAYQDERALLRLQRSFKQLLQLGASAALARTWAEPDPAMDEAVDATARLKHVVKARYDDTQWLDLAPRLRENLRERQRAALVAYLVAHPNADRQQRWKSVDGLSAHFLIDVEMSPCLLTSRIGQAVSSVQLFILRCLMNLEEAGAPVAAEDWSLYWRWMKNYRIWEANRKVFLYPENWIEPELRDDKSPFFKALEGDLVQNDLTTETAEAAFAKYLAQLDEVAHLEICGVHREVEAGAAAADHPALHLYSEGTVVEELQLKLNAASATVRLNVDGIFDAQTRRAVIDFQTANGLEPNGLVGNDTWAALDGVTQAQAGTPRSWSPTNILHVFGRTSPGPHTYYYRRRIDGAYWTPWEKVDLDIEGEHLIPVVWNRRLYLFWPIFSVVSDEVEIDPDANGPGRPPGRSNEIQMAWSEYKNGRWTSKKVTSGETSEKAKVPTATADGWQEFSFRASIVGQDLRITGFTPIIPAFEFRFSSGQIASQIVEPRDDTRIHFGGDVGISGMRFVEINASADRFYLESVDRTVLGRTPGEFRLLTPAQNRDLDPVGPFFYQDDARAFFVTTLIGEVGDDAGRTIYYQFHPFYHPYVREFTKQLTRRGIGGLMDPDGASYESWRLRHQQIRRDFFDSLYDPQENVALRPYPADEVDVSDGGAYSLYNWELFFQAPLLIADRLSKNQRFEESQKWFHYIFDPTDRSSEPGSRRFWRFRKFYEDARSYDEAGEHPPTIEDLMADTPELTRQVDRWRKHPFNPHLLARMRTTAYQKTVVMKYLDNLIAWGDQLFRRDTIEALNEATLLYVLAAEILGPKPEMLPARDVSSMSYNQLKGDIDAFGNAFVAEGENLLVGQGGDVPDGMDADAPLSAVGPTLYFCIPPNSTLLGYWDIVADRLDKIRHCKNIEGVVRQPPPFGPPIDPGLLVRATAAGVDLTSALNDISAPLPHYRFGVLLQKATEFCQDVKALGASLLSAIEKRDGEALAIIRATQESEMLGLVEQVRIEQVKEAQEQEAGLLKTRDAAWSRYLHYQRLLGNTDLQKPEVGQPVPEYSFSASIQIVRTGPGPLAATGGVKATSYEQQELDRLDAANDAQQLAGGFETLANYAHLVPDFEVAAEPWGVGSATTFGGSFVGSALSTYASFFRNVSAQASYDASSAARIGSLALREHDWGLQVNTAAHEMAQIDQQIFAARTRRGIADQELSNHRAQIDNARDVEAFMREKYSNQELYGWWVGRVSGIYFQAYQVAYDVAKRAERAYRFELGLTDTSFIQFGYWDSLKKGLLAGEALHNDLKRLDVAFLEQNKREYEITKHVSLVLHDPRSLTALKQTGTCEVELPESMFDADYPGHYLRRIKTVSLTIPSVVGPYTSVNCTVTLLSNKTRVKNSLLDRYAERTDEADDRFVTSFAALQSIATSHAQNDSGLFELNFRDERYLPFEGAGVVSRWRIDLPRDCNAFDFDTIADVVIRMHYSARDGGEQLRTAARQAVIVPPLRNLSRLFSARNEFPDKWHDFLHPGNADATVTLELDFSQERFPFRFRGRTIAIDQVELFMVLKDGVARRRGDLLTMSASPPQDAAVARVFQSADSFMNGTPHAVVDVSGGVGTWTFSADKHELENLIGILNTTDPIKDIILICRYMAI